MELLGRRAWWRGLLLLGLMFALVMQLGYLASIWVGLDDSGGGVYAGFALIALVAVVAIVANLGAYFYCDRYVLRSTGARLVDATSEPELYGVVQGLSVASGLPMPRVGVIDDPAPNAFATGRDPERAVVVATSGLLETLDRDELEAVMAHELGHVYNRDTLVSSICAVCVGIVTMVVQGLMRARGSSRNRANVGAFVIGGLLAITLLPAVQLVMFAVSRRREALADLTGVRFCRNPEALHSALTKITSSGAVPQQAKPATAHLYFYMPKLKGHQQGLDWMSNLTSSHPSPKERLDTLERVQHGQSVDYLFQSRGAFGISSALIALVTVALVAVPAWLLGGRNVPDDTGSLRNPALSISVSEVAAP